MKLTDARRRGLDALAAVYPSNGHRSNVTDVERGLVYWQTADWLIANALAEPIGLDGTVFIALTPRGVDVVNGGRQCRECGCTDNSACDEGCAWVEPDLCSACAPEAVPA